MTKQYESKSKTIIKGSEPWLPTRDLSLCSRVRPEPHLLPDDRNRIFSERS